MATVRKSLGEVLVEKGTITLEQIDQAREVQKSAPGDLGNIIQDLGFASERAVAEARSQELGIPFVDLSKFRPEAAALKSVPEHLVKRYNILPIRRQENKLMVAVADTKSSATAIDDVRLVSRCQVTQVLAARADLEDAIIRAYDTNAPSAPAPNGLGRPAVGNGKSAFPAIIKEESSVPAVPDAEVSALSQAIRGEISELQGNTIDEDDETGMERLAEEAPIIRIAYAIIQQAIREKASDIHIEPAQRDVRIRYRIDGVLNETMRVPKHIQPPLISRFKIMAEMNIAERRVPQDGRIPIKVNNKDYDLRVSCLPSKWGEKIVMRILDNSSTLVGLNKLGFEPGVQASLEELVAQPNGMVLTTGPTGSGKTTTLYSVLHKINSVEKNIITIEDPIEYTLAGVTQVQVNKKAGLTFATGLRSFLRQDPDIIMVGEMRDLETAQIAVEASLTGHLVLSTLHTNDAPSAIMRLADMGIETYLIAATVIGIMAQRLCRRICFNCKEGYKVPATYLSSFGYQAEDEEQQLTLFRGTGCEECRYKGYKGRVGLYELMVMNEEIAELVVRRAPVADIREAAKAGGMKELREDGLLKILEGMTTPEEVRRVVFTAGF